MTTLYRLYDTHGDLLYVGIADNWPARMKQHSAEKAWWGEVARTNLEQYPNRTAAETAEREAIRQGEPRFNIMHNTWASRGKSNEVESNLGVLKLGDVVALGLEDGSCPVGYVSDLSPHWVGLDLYSWLSGMFGFRQQFLPMRTILSIVKASKMTRAAAKAAGYGDDPNIFDMDPLADVQTRWVDNHKQPTEETMQ